MAELLAAIIGFPAVVPTVLLGVALLYWLLVMFGALDVDLFSADGAADGVLDGAAEGAQGLLHAGADGAADGVLDGVADGAADGVVDGVADGVVDGVADGAAEGAHAIVHTGHADGLAHGSAHGAADAVAHGSVVSLLSLAHFRSVPITVTASVLTVFTWLLCVVGVRLLPSGVEGLSGWLMGSVVLIASAVLSLVPTAVVIRPLGRFFRVHGAKSHRELVGRVCDVTTGTVGPKFGQARLKVEDLDLIVQVRHEKPDVLSRGDRALIVSWDPSREAFVVEPYDKLLEPGR